LWLRVGVVAVLGAVVEEVLVDLGQAPGCQFLRILPIQLPLVEEGLLELPLLEVKALTLFLAL
jgi:hypothetical protein